MANITSIFFWLTLCFAPASLVAEEARPRSIIVLDQSDVRGPFYYEVFSSLRSVVNAGTALPITIYAESLELSRFGGSAYEEGLQQYFRTKYRDKPVGVLVAIGSAALENTLRWRPAVWPGVPVVFSMVDEPTVARLDLPSDVTGSIMRLRLADMMTIARDVVPGLKRIAFVGDAWDSQTVYRHWKDEIPVATVGLEVVDWTGLTMQELRNRVATLPERTAIVY